LLRGTITFSAIFVRGDRAVHRGPEAGSGLIPPLGTPERYRVQEWLNFITSELHKVQEAMKAGGLIQ
jgi:glutathione S-transferase